MICLSILFNIAFYMRIYVWFTSVKLMSDICIKTLHISYKHLINLSLFSILQDSGVKETEEEEFYVQGKYLFLIVVFFFFFFFFFNMKSFKNFKFKHFFFSPGFRCGRNRRRGSLSTREVLFIEYESLKYTLNSFVSCLNYVKILPLHFHLSLNFLQI